MPEIQNSFTNNFWLFSYKENTLKYKHVRAHAHTNTRTGVPFNPQPNMNSIVSQF